MDRAPAVIEKPLQVFVNDFDTSTAEIALGQNEVTTAFLVDVIRMTQTNSICKALTQNLAPTRRVDKKVVPQAPGWEITGKFTEIKQIQDGFGAGQLTLATVVEVTDLQSSRLLMTLTTRYQYNADMESSDEADGGPVTPWNEPLPRIRHKGVPDDLIEAMQTDTERAARQISRRLANAVRQGN
jgi:hypothetical protein